MNDTTSDSTTLETSEPEISDFAPRKILGWHFSHDTKLAYNDNRPIIIGETLSVEGDIIPCQNGLHASKNALGAFEYVKGNYLWRVELEDDLRSHPNLNEIVDKWVGRKRKVLAGGDATEMLKKFGHECVLEVLHLWLDAPEEVRQFFKTGVITKAVDDYYKNHSYDAYDSYDASAYDASNVSYYSYFAAFYTYYVYKNYNTYHVHNTICYAANALNIPYEAYANKFEKACLDFIEEKS